METLEDLEYVDPAWTKTVEGDARLRVRKGEVLLLDAFVIHFHSTVSGHEIHTRCIREGDTQFLHYACLL